MVFPRATTFRPARTTTVAPPIGDGVPVVKKAATMLAFFFAARVAFSEAWAGPRSSACVSIVPAVFGFPVPAP